VKTIDCYPGVVSDPDAFTPKTRPRSRRPRLRDVADLAEVDISVASRALRNRPELNVRPETQLRIEKAAKSLGYVANPAAASLKTARTSAIGLILPSLFNPGGALIAQGASAQAAASGYLLLIATGTAAECIPMLEPRVDGILVASATSEPGALPDTDSVHVPILLVNRREPGPFPGLVVDDETGARIATDYLVSLGHVDIGHVAGPQQTDTSRRRRAGFESSLRENGLQVRREWIAEGPYDEAGGYIAASAILEQAHRPTALLVSNLLATVGAMSAARRLGISVPEDLSLITFDDVAIAMYIDPPITTVRLPLADLGRQSVGVLTAMIGGSHPDGAIIGTQPEVVLRQSCAPPKPRSVS
jgi:LacI family transcriptional regulator